MTCATLRHSSTYSGIEGGTWGVYTFEDIDKASSKLTLTTLGWRDGDKEWNDAYDYFLKANAQYLNMVVDHAASIARSTHD